jgi:hypothetical protein
MAAEPQAEQPGERRGAAVLFNKQTTPPQSSFAFTTPAPVRPPPPERATPAGRDGGQSGRLPPAADAPGFALAPALRQQRLFLRRQPGSCCFACRASSAACCSRRCCSSSATSAVFAASVVPWPVTNFSPVGPSRARSPPEPGEQPSARRGAVVLFNTQLYHHSSSPSPHSFKPDVPARHTARH